jgi:hypothetical protein
MASPFHKRLIYHLPSGSEVPLTTYNPPTGSSSSGSASGSSTSSLWSPALMAIKPRHWFDAQTRNTISTGSAASVTQWNDLGTAAANATGSTTANIPVYVTSSRINNYPALRSTDLVRKLRFTPDIPELDSVYHGNSATSVEVDTNVGFVYTGASGFPSFETSSIVYIDWSPTTINLYYNGTFVTSSITLWTPGVSASLSGSTAFVVCMAPYSSSATSSRRFFSAGNLFNVNTTDRGMIGDLGEVAFWKYPLDTTNRQKVEGYAAWRWGLTGSLPTNHPYRFNAPTTGALWTPANLLASASWWLDAQNATSITTSSLSVLTWANLAASGGLATSSAGLYPSYSVAGINGHPALYVSNSMMTLPSASLGVGGIQRIGDGGNTASINIVEHGTNVNNLPVTNLITGSVVVYSYNQANYTLWQNGTAMATGSISGIPDQNCVFVVQKLDANPNLGRWLSFGNLFNAQGLTAPAVGNFGEILALQYEPSAAERQKIEGYMAWRWGMQNQLPVGHPYFSGAPLLVPNTGSGGGSSNTRPTASIFLPTGSAIYSQSVAITFSGSAIDAQDGVLSGGSLVWTSNLDGVIGTGSVFSKSTLSPGSQTVTLTATDALGLAGTAAVNFTILSSASLYDDTAELPRITPTKVRWENLTFSSSVSVTAANLQSTLNSKAALAGGNHEIILQNGQVFTGPLTLPSRINSGSGWIVVRSQTMPCSASVRAHYSNFSNQGLITTPGANATAIETQQGVTGVKNYILAGLQISLGTADDINTLVKWGELGSPQLSLAQCPDNIGMDRCLVMGARNNLKHALAIHCATAWVCDSHFHDIHYNGADSQAIFGCNGPGPWLIENNYLEASCENIIFGGASVSIPNLIPSDITIRYNHMAKPISWVSDQWDIKNIFELKIGRRVLVEGNVFENNWARGQDGTGILLKSVDQDGGSPWLQTVDVTFRYNFIRNVGSPFNFSGNPQGGAVPMAKLSVHDNVAVNINTGQFTGNGRDVMAASETSTHWHIIHNTFAHVDTSPLAITLDLEYICPDLYFTDNLSARPASYGIMGSGLGQGLSTWNTNAPGDSICTRNVIGGDVGPPAYPGTNYFPGTAFTSIGFTDPTIRFRYTTDTPDQICAALILSGSSPYKGLGNGGSDPGANMGLVRSAIAKGWANGYISGSFASYTSGSAVP